MYYSTDIFMSAGLTAETSQYATLGMGGMNVLMTVVSLAIIEKAGRKTLMLLGLAGMMFDVILLTICLALKVNSQNCLRCSILTDTDGGVMLWNSGRGRVVGVLQHHLGHRLRGVFRHRSRLNSLVSRHGTL